MCGLSMRRIPRGPNAQVQGRPLGIAGARAGGGVPCNAQLGACWKKNITCLDWSDYRNELQWLAAGAYDSVHLALLSYDNITGRDFDGVAMFVDLINAMTSKNCPCVLPFWMHMGGYRLPRLNVPGDDDCMFRLQDHGANWLAVAGLHVVA